MILDIREVTLEDAEAVVRILNPIIAAGAYTALDTLLSVEDQREFIRTFSPRGIFLVAVERSDGRIVGLQDVDPFSGYTHAFDHVGVIGTFVDLERRRRGIGRALFAAMFPAARVKGYEKLFTYVRADNVAALAAYEAQGFECIGIARRHAKLNGSYVDEVLIEKFL
jgi:L-amino acid N-acyltransferase YncA